MAARRRAETAVAAMRKRSRSRLSSFTLVPFRQYQLALSLQLCSPSLNLSRALAALAAAQPICLLAAILTSVRLCIVSAPAVASASIRPLAEAVLSVCGVPQQSWRSEMEQLRQRLEVQQCAVAAVDAPVKWCQWWADVYPQIRVMQALKKYARISTIWPGQAAPPATAELARLLQVSSDELKQLTMGTVMQQLQQIQLQQQNTLMAMYQRIAVDQVALLLLEGEGVAADCVGIVAQYLNSDFEQQPYVSAYKQH